MAEAAAAEARRRSVAVFEERAAALAAGADMLEQGIKATQQQARGGGTLGPIAQCVLHGAQSQRGPTCRASRPRSRRVRGNFGTLCAAAPAAAGAGCAGGRGVTPPLVAARGYKGAANGCTAEAARRGPAVRARPRHRGGDPAPPAPPQVLATHARVQASICRRFEAMCGLLLHGYEWALTPGTSPPLAGAAGRGTGASSNSSIGGGGGGDGGDGGSGGGVLICFRPVAHAGSAASGAAGPQPGAAAWSSSLEQLSGGQRTLVGGGGAGGGGRRARGARGARGAGGTWVWGLRLCSCMPRAQRPAVHSALPSLG